MKDPLNRLMDFGVSLERKVNSKLDELESKMDEIVQHFEEQDAKITKFEDETIGLIEEIRNLPTIQGNPGKDADNESIAKNILSQLPRTDIELENRILNKVPRLDESTLEQRILSKIPKIDKSGMMKEFLSKVPKQNLKVLQQRIENDPMSVITKILELPENKFKLKTTHIDGLEQTISSFRNQIATRGYLHGGGDTIVAGTNITVSTNSNGTKTINFAPSQVNDGNSGSSLTVNWTTANYHKSTMTANCTFIFTAPASPTHLTLVLTQDATGSRIPTWPATVKWVGGVAPTLTTTGGSIDIITLYYDGTNYFGGASFNFA